ncbi:MAG: o-succinylbenzoate synthase [Nakamurella sp.]
MSTDRADILGAARVFALPMRLQFRGITTRSGMLLSGPAGVGEFAPFDNYTDEQCVPWLRSALEAAETGWPAPRRDRVPVNTTVPVVDPDTAHRLVAESGCRTAKVKVADRGAFAEVLAADAERVAAVRAALGPAGAIRVDANGAWSVAEALQSIAVLDVAAGGLQYVEQPCATVAELAEVRRATHVLIAADESIRLAGDPAKVALAGAADVAVIKVAPLGGVRRSLQVAAAAGLRVVVSSAVDSAVGLAAGLALAGALPTLELACGLGTGSLLADDVSTAGMVVVDGFLPVPTRAPEPDRIDAVAADPERERWWRDRLARVAALLG